MNYKELLFNKDKVLSFYPELAVILNKYDKILAEEEYKNGDGTGKKRKAGTLGLNEAIIINQISYWNEINKKTNNNFKDGYYWTYNTYEKWAKNDFPYWSADTIRKSITALESMEIIVSTDKYNSYKIDNTKWYRVDYDKLQKIIDIVEQSEKESSSESKNELPQVENESCGCVNVSYTDGLGNLNKPIPETTTDITNKDYSTENTDKYALKDKSFKDCDNMYASVSEKQEGEQKPKKKSRYIPKDYTEEQLREHIRPTISENFERIEIENGLEHISDGEKLLEDITVEFFRQYEENMGVKHNILPDKSYINVIRMFVCSTGELREYFDLETYEIMITRYFETDFNRYGKYDGEVTLCLSHFMNDTIRSHLLNREGILWEKADEED